MNKKGGILLGNGGDNGNGSSGTFYEGVMTAGYPTEATTDAVQANIVAAKYDVQRVNLTRATTFTPKSVQSLTVTFNNTTGITVTGVKLSIATPKGWTAFIPGTNIPFKTFAGPIAPGASVSITLNVTAPTTVDAGFLTGRAEWKSAKVVAAKIETTTQRVRNAFPVKINEVRFSTGNNPTNQFIELYNASESQVDISGWSIINTPSEWATVKLGTIPAGTKIGAHDFYVLGLATSGLTAPASAGQNIIHVQNTTGLQAGQPVEIEGEKNTIANLGTPASPMTTLYVPVSTGTRLTIQAGSINLPVTNAAGFTVGHKIGIDVGGNYEIATVTAVGKAATQANLYAAAKAGNTTIKVTDNANMTVGDMLAINTGARKEFVKVKRIINVVTAPARGTGEAGEVELTAPLKSDHMVGVDIYEAGTGISFSPATRFAHKSADVIQALGTGITLNSKLTKSHSFGAAIVNANNTTSGYQASQKPDQWYGYPLSATEGSIALMDASGKILVDGLVYGPPQSNSSANGTITSPEIATLEGDQGQGGCIVVLPVLGRGADQSNRSVGRFPDGYDTDSNCGDFLLQNTITLFAPSAVGSNNIKVSSVTGFKPGQKAIIGSGANSETATIATVGTAGATTIGTATDAGATVIPVVSVAGFSAGQTIVIGSGANMETAVIASVTAVRRRPGTGAGGPSDSIILNAPLKYAHASFTQVSGTGITFATPLTMAHDNGVQVVNGVPTPGKGNQYVR